MISQTDAQGLTRYFIKPAYNSKEQNMKNQYLWKCETGVTFTNVM